MLQFNVQRVYFDAIKAGTKTIEGRLAKQKYLDLRPGDSVVFFDNEHTESVTKTVTAIHLYPTFEAAFKEQDFRKAIPSAKTVKEAIAVYEQFYTPQMQQQERVVFIELR
ncbi:MAG TPA: ASCH domain-containing protein [Candidatus Pristimantibacillus sp.]|jgi:ASC-1-like (ASCH) protein|nr:ASCH domain-containing protein [Candidatus Pristimantibacillus sp.]